MGLFRSLACLVVAGLSAGCIIHVQVDPDDLAEAHAEVLAEHVAQHHQGEHGDLIDPAAWTIRGNVLDEAGQPVRAQVALVYVGGGGSRSRGTHKNGHFRFERLPEATFVATAVTADGRIAVVPDVRPGQEVELRLGQGGRIQVALEDNPEGRLAVFHGEQRVHDGSFRSGDSRTLVVPAGHTRW